MKNIFIITLITILFSGCFGESKKEWTSLIHPDKTNTKRLVNNGVYETLKECKDASLIRLKELSSIEKGDFDCGLNCVYNEGFKSYICKELKR